MHTEDIKFELATLHFKQLNVTWEKIHQYIIHQCFLSLNDRDIMCIFFMCLQCGQLKSVCVCVCVNEVKQDIQTASNF